MILESGIAILGLAIVCQWVVLRSLLLESTRPSVAINSQANATSSDVVRVPTVLPSFRVRQLNRAEPASQDNLRGKPSILLFISTSSVESLAPERVGGILHALWSKTDGRLYVAYDGSESECRSFSEGWHVQKRFGGDLLVWMDPGGSLRRLFGIASSPAAIVVDESGKITKTGHLASEPSENSELIGLY